MLPYRKSVTFTAVGLVINDTIAYEKFF